MSDDATIVAPALRSADLSQLAAALAAAQGELEPALKDATNPDVRSRYATLASCWDALRGPLSRNGLAVTQLLRTGADGVQLETMLLHSSGQWLASLCRVEPVARRRRVGNPQAGQYETMPLTIQDWGSALTYARRYCLAAITGLTADDREDDDGRAAAAHTERHALLPDAKVSAKTTAARPDTKNTTPSSPASTGRHPRVEALLAAYARKGWQAEMVCAVLGVTDVDAIGADQIKAAEAHYRSIKGPPMQDPPEPPAREPGDDRDFGDVEF